MKAVAMMVAGTMLLGLAACDKGDGNKGSGKPQSAQDVAAEMKKITIRPGEWETTQEVIDVKVEGAPQGMPTGMFEAMKGRKVSARNCITPEQVNKPSADFLAAQKDSKCTYSGFAMSGGKISGEISCPAGDGGGATHVTTSGSYTPESYEMTGVMQSNGMGAGSGMPGMDKMTMRMTVKTVGKRIGACTPEAGTPDASKP